MSVRIVAAIAGLALAAAPPCPATAGTSEEPPSGAAAIRARYAKFEHRVPMRDGTRLFTVVYAPNDASESRRYPILMERTPYSAGPYGADRYRDWLAPEELEDEGFIFVWQDVRGRYMSEGTFVDLRPRAAAGSRAAIDETTDTYDTIEWLLRNVPHHNGKVGLAGLSYPGFYASVGAIDSHPALVAVSPQAPIADWFWDDMHRHGAFNLALAFTFFSSFGTPRPEPTEEQAGGVDFNTPDGYQYFLELGRLADADDRVLGRDIPFWNDLAAHPNYDEFWKARDVLPHLRGIKCAVLTVGGWFDTEDLYGPLRTYEAIERHNPGISNSLVMGPWSHGQWLGDPGEKLGSAEFGSPTGEWFRDNVLLPFFRQHLKGEGRADVPEVLAFETGANRWRRFSEWPPTHGSKRTLYFADRGGLDWQPPTATGVAFDEYVSDPAKPVPYTAEIVAGWSKNHMTEDQRFAARRPDVLVYRTAPLDDDVIVAGPLEVELWVSTTGQDADFVVKLIDEYPGEPRGLSAEEAKKYPGHRQMLVRGEPFRGRFRESYERPVPFVPGQPARITFRMNDILHNFQRGHRIMVQVQSTWFPFIDRNPQSWVDNIFEARPEDFVRATQRVYRSAGQSSSLTLTVLPAP